MGEKLPQRLEVCDDRLAEPVRVVAAFERAHDPATAQPLGALHQRTGQRERVIERLANPKVSIRQKKQIRATAGLTA